MHTFANPQQVVLSWYRMARHLKELLFCLFFSSQSFSHAPTESVVPGRHSVCTVCMFSVCVSVCVFSVFTGVTQYAWCWFTNMKYDTEHAHSTHTAQVSRNTTTKHGTVHEKEHWGVALQYLPTLPTLSSPFFSSLLFSPLLFSSHQR